MRTVYIFSHFEVNISSVNMPFQLKNNFTFDTEILKAMARFVLNICVDVLAVDNITNIPV